MLPRVSLTDVLLLLLAVQSIFGGGFLPPSIDRLSLRSCPGRSFF